MQEIHVQHHRSPKLQAMPYELVPYLHRTTRIRGFGQRFQDIVRKLEDFCQSIYFVGTGLRTWGRIYVHLHQGVHGDECLDFGEECDWHAGGTGALPGKTAKNTGQPNNPKLQHRPLINPLGVPTFDIAVKIGEIPESII